jgi:exonuclease VII large subunit
MQIIIDAMKKHLKKKDHEYEKQNQYTLKAQLQIQKDIDEFDQKMIQLNLALSQISAIKQEIVVRKDLAQIEDRIKTSFKDEVEKYKAETIFLKEQLKESNKRIDSLEKGIVREPKKSWFSKN